MLLGFYPFGQLNTVLTRHNNINNHQIIRPVTGYQGAVIDDQIVAAATFFGDIRGKLLEAKWVDFCRREARRPMSKVAAIIQQVAFSAYARLQDDIEQVRRYFLGTVEVASLVMFPLLWGLSSVSPEFVAVVLGNDWLEATTVLRIVCIIVPFQFVSLLLYPLLDGLGHPGISLRNLITSSCIMSVLIVIGVNWDLAGVSTAIVVGTLLSQAINYRRSLPVLDCGLGQLALAIAPNTYCALTMYCAVTIAREFLLHLSDFWRLPLLIAIGGAIYVAMTILINRDAVSKSMNLIRVNE